MKRLYKGLLWICLAGMLAGMGGCSYVRDTVLSAKETVEAVRKRAHTPAATKEPVAETDGVHQ